MKRQFTRWTALVLLLTVILSILAGCAQLHPHSFGQWETVKEPTCTEPGEQVGLCSCGKEMTIEIEPLGHKEGTWVTVKEATELEPGRKELLCERCGVVIRTEMIPYEALNNVTMPPKDKTYTINILTQRKGDYGYFNDAADQWFFQFIEHWFALQGYTVHINIQESNEIYQTKILSLNTHTLPDIFWGVELRNEEIVRYAIEEGIILEWTPYINEILMPNLSKLFAEQPESKVLSTASNNGIYGIPYYSSTQFASDCFGESQRLYFRQSWLDRVGLQNPTTKDELLNVLRQFKYQITDLSADTNDVPLVSVDGLLEKYLWTCMGFYGCEPGRFGTNLCIQYEDLVLPAYTESYRDFITFMKTAFDEDLISKDFFSIGESTVRARVMANKCGAFCSSDLEYINNDFEDAICANPIPMGDIVSTEDIHVSLPDSVYPNYIWASSSHEEPRILAMLIDFIYSEEGAWLYYYGPKQGEDPLGLVDGWYLDENGNITTKMVAEGQRTSMEDYAYMYLYPNDFVGLRPAAGAVDSDAVVEFTDSVTGETYTRVKDVMLTPNTHDGHWRLITTEKWSDRATSIRIPTVNLNSDKMTEFLDFQKAIRAWIDSETIRFITGIRPVSEIEEFWKELENLGIKEYLKLAEEGYADWMKATFG